MDVHGVSLILYDLTVGVDTLLSLLDGSSAVPGRTWWVMSLKWSTSSIRVAGERKAWDETWALLEELRATLGDVMDDDD